MATYTIREGQNLFDVAIQLMGSVEYVYEIIGNNPALLYVQDINLTGTSITYTEQKKDLTNYFKNNSITIVSGSNLSGDTSQGLATDDGILLSDDDGNFITID